MASSFLTLKIDLISLSVLLVFRFVTSQQQSFTSTPPAQTLAVIGQNVTLTWKYDSAGKDVIFRKFSVVQENNIGIFNILTKVEPNAADPKGDYIGRIAFKLDAEIVIESLRISDESYIGFTVEFDGGTTLFHKTYLEIGIPASITLSPVALNVVLEGGITNLRCEASGKAAPTITWLLNGATLANTDARTTITETDLGVSSNVTKIRSDLMLQNAFPSDLGVIACVASNNVGNDVFNTTQDVYFSSRGTSLVTDPVGNQGVLSQPLTITCEAQGNPAIFYAIYKDNILLRNTSSGVLSFAQLAIPDEAIYKCSPVNYLGAAPDEEIPLTVTVPPILESSTLSQENALLGDTVTLQCVFYGEPEPTVTWSKAGQSLPVTASPSSSVQSQNASFTKVRSRLTITNVARLDYGTYTCKAVNSFGERNTSVDLDIQYEPIVKENSTTVITVLAPFNSPNTHQFFCLVDANPRAIVAWYRGTTLLSNSSDVTITEIVISNGDNHVTTNNTLTLIDWTRLSTGSYKCIANNARGSDERSMPIIVQYSPEIVAPLITITTVLEGTPVDIQCEFHSLPESNVTWTKDGSLLSNIANSVSQNLIESSLVGGSSIVTKVTVPTVQRSDAGSYECIAENAFGKVKNQTLLVVNFLPVETASSPPQSSGTRGQGSLQLFCSWVAQPMPVITWSKNGIALTAGVSSSILSQTSQSTEVKSTLTLQSLTPQDSGNYSCVANNSIGTNQLEKTVTISYAPVFVAPMLSNVTLTTGNPLSLTCATEGYPVPSLVWLKGGNPVDLTVSNVGFTVSETVVASFRFRVVSNLTFTSTSRSDAASFSCFVNNSISFASQQSAVVINYTPVITPSFSRQQNYTETFTVFALECIVEANPPPVVTWWKNDNPVSVSIVNDTTLISNQFLTKISSQLMFAQGIRRGDYGDYECQANNTQGLSDESVTTYVVYKPESLIPLDGSLDTTKGSSIVFNCTVRANPLPVVTWTKDGVPLSGGFTVSTISSSVSAVVMETILSIANVDQMDSASYACSAVNTVSSLVQTIALNVQFKPEFTIASSNYTVNETSSLVLPCTVNANPSDVKYVWHKDGTVITSAQSNTLTLSNAHANTNGLYQCTPENSLGTGSTVSFQVLVTASPFVVSNAQCLQRNSASSVYFNCSCAGSGTPDPRVYWTKYPKTEVLSNTSILIVNVVADVDGTYQCHFENTEGRITTNTAIAFYGTKFGQWSDWSDCNNTCGTGIQIKQRACNIPPCSVPETIINQNCVDETCPGKLTNDDEESWVIALYVLIPLLFVVCILLILWLSRLNRNKEEKPVTVPVNSNISKPPSVRSIPTRQEIYLPNNHYGVLNAGYRPEHEQATEAVPDKEMESIEVEMNFDAEGPESETDNTMILPPHLRNGDLSRARDNSAFDDFPVADYDLNDLDDTLDFEHDSSVAAEERMSSPDEEEGHYMTPPHRPFPQDNESTIFTSL